MYRIQAGRALDLNFPDKTLVEPGEHITKKWRVTNTGMVSWPPSCKCNYASGEIFPIGELSIDLPILTPGANLTIAFDLAVPRKPGLYKSQFQLTLPDMTPFFYLWVTLRVKDNRPAAERKRTAEIDKHLPHMPKNLELVLGAWEEDDSPIRKILQAPIHVRSLGWTLLVTLCTEDITALIIDRFIEHTALGWELVVEIMEALRDAKLLITLTSLAERTVQAILPKCHVSHTNSIENAKGALKLLDYILSGHTHSPSLFFLSIPTLVALLDQLEGKNDLLSGSSAASPSLQDDNKMNTSDNSGRKSEHDDPFNAIVSIFCRMLYYFSDFLPLCPELTQRLVASKQNLNLTVDQKQRLYKGWMPDAREDSMVLGQGYRSCSGLKNLGNTCYQNSVLQALFNTKTVRDALLTIDFKEEATKAAYSLGDPDSFKVTDRLKSVEVSSQVQKLFARLKYGKLKYQNQEDLKSKLMDPFNGREQQDALSYAQYIVSTINEGLSDTKIGGLMTDHSFGGCFRNIRKCLTCGTNSTQEERFTDLCIPTPDVYAPITAVTIVMSTDSTIKAPEGFERLPTNCNIGREKDGGYAYICVKRGEDLPPITHIQVVVCAIGEEKTIELDRDQWELVDGNLNFGADHAVYLAVRRLPNGCPITDVMIVYDDDRLVDNIPTHMEQLNGDLNYHGGGKYVYLCVSRQASIRDIQLISGESLDEIRQAIPETYQHVPTNLNLFCPNFEYRFYKLEFTHIRHDQHGYIQLAEIRFWNKNGQARPVKVEYVSPGSSPKGEEPPRLIDSVVSSKWMDLKFGVNSGSSLLFDMGDGPTPVLTKYELMTANDCPDRDPTKWSLSASQDGHEWHVLDIQDRVHPPDERLTWYNTFDIETAQSNHDQKPVFLAYTTGGASLPITGISARIATGDVDMKQNENENDKEGSDSQETVLPYSIGSANLELVITRGHGAPIKGLEVFRTPFLPQTQGEYVDLILNQDEKEEETLFVQESGFLVPESPTATPSITMSTSDGESKADNDESSWSDAKSSSMEDPPPLSQHMWLMETGEHLKFEGDANDVRDCWVVHAKPENDVAQEEEEGQTKGKSLGGLLFHNCIEKAVLFPHHQHPTSFTKGLNGHFCDNCKGIGTAFWRCQVGCNFDVCNGCFLKCEADCTVTSKYEWQLNGYFQSAETQGLVNVTFDDRFTWMVGKGPDGNLESTSGSADLTGFPRKASSSSSSLSPSTRSTNGPVLDLIAVADGQIAPPGYEQISQDGLQAADSIVHLYALTNINAIAPADRKDFGPITNIILSQAKPDQKQPTDQDELLEFVRCLPSPTTSTTSTTSETKLNGAGNLESRAEWKCLDLSSSSPHPLHVLVSRTVSTDETSTSTEMQNLDGDTPDSPLQDSAETAESTSSDQNIPNPDDPISTSSDSSSSSSSSSSSDVVDKVPDVSNETEAPIEGKHVDVASVDVDNSDDALKLPTQEAQEERESAVDSESASKQPVQLDNNASLEESKENADAVKVDATVVEGSNSNSKSNSESNSDSNSDSNSNVNSPLYLHDLQLISRLDQVPDGFEAVVTTFQENQAHLPGDDGKSFYLLCFRRAVKSCDQEDQNNNNLHQGLSGEDIFARGIEGQVWSTSVGSFSFSVLQRSRCRKTKTSFHHGNSYIQGYLATRTISSTQRSFILFGAYKTRQMKSEGSIQLSFNQQLTRVLGTSSTRVSWNGKNDMFVKLKLSRNVFDYWQDGKEIFSLAATGKSISNCVQSYFAPEIISGDNRAVCTQCNSKQDESRWCCLKVLPKNLIVGVKIFEYDWKTGRSSKLLDAVEVDPFLVLPSISSNHPSDLVKCVFDSEEEEKDAADNLYGLYGILVHCGENLNRGHYIIYARSDAGDLSSPEVASNPWHKYNDEKVSNTNFEAICASLRHKFDRGYVYFYKRLSKQDSVQVQSYLENQEKSSEDMVAPALNDAQVAHVSDEKQQDLIDTTASSSSSSSSSSSPMEIDDEADGKSSSIEDDVMQIDNVEDKDEIQQGGEKEQGKEEEKNEEISLEPGNDNVTMTDCQDQDAEESSRANNVQEDEGNADGDPMEDIPQEGKGEGTALAENKSSLDIESKQRNNNGSSSSVSNEQNETKKGACHMQNDDSKELQQATEISKEKKAPHGAAVDDSTPFQAAVDAEANINLLPSLITNIWNDNKKAPFRLNANVVELEELAKQTRARADYGGKWSITIPAKRQGPPQTWNCGICTFANSPARTLCEMCGASAPAKRSPADNSAQKQAQQPQASESKSTPICSICFSQLHDSPDSCPWSIYSIQECKYCQQIMPGRLLQGHLADCDQAIEARQTEEKRAADAEAKRQAETETDKTVEAQAQAQDTSNKPNNTGSSNSPTGNNNTDTTQPMDTGNTGPTRGSSTSTDVCGFCSRTFPSNILAQHAEECMLEQMRAFQQM